ncbi:uncharacterized protein LOC113348017 [Papaver somniferum]|uniref:uncharacterized protein LOC113348017 n=1 Tax=Papaver somniferum TaxID=3469 RepID=UPI000E705C05|nr:uncharacterized protein LOC113348017 [Papaver somniferum]
MYSARFTQWNSRLPLLVSAISLIRDYSHNNEKLSNFLSLKISGETVKPKSRKYLWKQENPRTVQDFYNPIRYPSKNIILETPRQTKNNSSLCHNHCWKMATQNSRTENLNSRMQSANIGNSSTRPIRRIIAAAQNASDAVEEYTFSLLGRIIFKKPLDHEDVKKEINFRWRSYRRYQIITKGTNLFLFRFQQRESCDGVLAKTWDVLGHLLSPIRYDPNIPINDRQFIHHIWSVKLRNLGSIILNEHLINEICKDIGKRVIPEGRRRLPRGSVTNTVYVEVKLKEPLRRGGWIDTPNGQRLWVIYHYEMQPYKICKECWVVDHEEAACKRLAQE